MNSQNNKIIIIGIVILLASIVSYSLINSNQEQQSENPETIGIVKEFDLSIDSIVEKSTKLYNAI